MRQLLIVVCTALILIPSHSRAAEDLEDLARLAAGNNAAAFSLYSRLSDNSDNIFFSPFSISSALAMSYAGARGATAEQMAKVMHFPYTDEKLHQTYGNFLQYLRSLAEKDKFMLGNANSLWPQAGLELDKHFLEIVNRHYGAAVSPLDYARDEKAARATINKWVEDKTYGKIRDLLFSPLNDPRLILVNAVYFKGLWSEPFNKKYTAPAVFYSPEGEKNVPFMCKLEKQIHFRADGFQMIQLDYRGSSTSMVIILPDGKTIQDLRKIEESLNAESFKRLLKDNRSKNVDLRLTRFKLTWGAKSLVRQFQDLGMTNAFSQSAADFSAMTGKPDFRIDDVVHKAFVQVDEEGTEAAAATAVAIADGAAATSSKPVVFNADHPFLFFIVENRTNTILFMGRLATPPAE